MWPVRRRDRFDSKKSKKSKSEKFENHERKKWIEKILKKNKIKNFSAVEKNYNTSFFLHF